MIIVYNVGRIKEAQFPKWLKGQTEINTQPAGQELPDNSITQNTPVVNDMYMQDGADDTSLQSNVDIEKASEDNPTGASSPKIGYQSSDAEDTVPQNNSSVNIQK